MTDTDHDLIDLVIGLDRERFIVQVPRSHLKMDLDDFIEREIRPGVSILLTRLAEKGLMPP